MNRQDLYYNLNNKLSFLSNDEIKKIITVKKTDKFKKWGLNKIFELDNNKIFIKAVPVAKLFAENILDSTNLYNLPAYYNYGFGSAGVNPWRELLLHIKTTNWILSKECDFFPLLYHYRIIEDDDNHNIESGLEKKLMDRWNNNKQIEKYLQERINAKYKIVLFLEYIPNVAYKYLEDNPNFVSNFYKQSKNIISFLNKNGILHNDSHLGNYIVDNKGKVYLTDFGLSLDKDFNLDSNEKKFMKMNKKLDIYYTIDNILNNYINNCIYNKKIVEKYQLDKQKNTLEITKYLIDNINIIKNNISKISNFQINFIKKNKSLLLSYTNWTRNFKYSKNKNNYFVNKL